MTRNFDRDLTILVAGSGNVSMAHLQESLGEWIFPDSDAEREVHVILPLFAQMGSGIRNLIKTGIEWDFKFSIYQAKDAPMTRELSALPEESFFRMDTEREALETGLNFLGQCAEGGDETAFIMAYNPSSTYEQDNKTLSDFEILGDAKMHSWLTTLNLCEGLIDSFEGYKSPAELEKEERLRAEHMKKIAADAKEALEKAAPAEKAPAPRKRAPRKAVTPKVTKPVEELEKAPEELSVGTTVEVAGLKFTKTSPNPFREPLPTDAVLSANVVIPKKTEEIWDDVAEAALQNKVKETMAYVKRSDLSDLSEGIKELTQSFGKIMDTFTRILKEN